jgi:CPA2 family monovalent cation:H+ antiporter-2
VGRASTALAGLGASFFGVPLALAAFLAGLAVAESPVAAEARRQLLPFRDLFAVMFFVAVGTLIDPNHLAGALPWLGLAIGCLVVFKSAVIYGLARLVRPAGVRPQQLAIGLGQVGEFSFVVGSIGVAAGIIDPAAYSGLLFTMVVTICLSAVLVRVVHRGVQPSSAVQL